MRPVKPLMLPVVFLSCILPASLLAQQANFMVSPPPIPWHEFQMGQKDLKVTGTALHMTGEITDDTTGNDLGDVKVYGGGASGFYRYAFREQVAFDIGGTILGAGGDVGKYATMDMWMISVPFDLEVQAYKSERLAVILFGGFNFTWLALGLDFDDGTDSVHGDIDSSMNGPQAGIQAAFKFPEWVITPFFMLTRLSGDADVSGSVNGVSGSASLDIPSTTSYLYGFDIVYLPWGLTLSSLIQQVASSGDNNGYQTYVLMLSYHFQLDAGGEKAPEEKPKAAPKAKPR